MGNAFRFLSVTQTVCVGLVAGTFFAFSTFVMPAIAKSPNGAQAMQNVNDVIVRSPFIAVFIAATLISLGLPVLARVQAPTAFPWALAASLLYLVGVIGVTAAMNVPLNNKLAAAGTGVSPAEWSAYVQSWSLWNHVRTISSASSLLCLALSLR